MTPAEVDQMRRDILDEVREVASASMALRFAGDFEGAARLRAAASRLLALAGASDVVLVFLIDEVLEDARGAR